MKKKQMEQHKLEIAQMSVFHVTARDLKDMKTTFIQLLGGRKAEIKQGHRKDWQYYKLFNAPPTH